MWSRNPTSEVLPMGMEGWAGPFGMRKSSKVRTQSGEPTR